MAEDGLTADMARDWIARAAAAMEENRIYLTELDGPIGDSDHGNNMQRGFEDALKTVPADGDVSAVLMAVGMALISKVGGAAGPLYGTYFREASKVAKDRDVLDGAILADALAAGAAGVGRLGKSEIEMKTMLDALVPAAETLAARVADGAALSDGLHAAVEAAEAGTEATIHMRAQRGRASYLGERSVGHQDPGATSSTMILRALEEAVQA